MYIFFVILKKVFIKSMNTSSIEYMSLSLLSIVRIEQAMFYKEQRENGSKKMREFVLPDEIPALLHGCWYCISDTENSSKLIGD